MKKILISQTCKSNVAKFYAYENQVEYSSIYMRIYATKKTDIFLLLSWSYKRTVKAKTAYPT